MSSNHTVVASPLGDLTLVADDGVLAGVYFDQHTRRPDPLRFGTRDDSVFTAATAQLAQYFAGTRTRFELPLAPRGTPFQRQVWQLLREIPYGETRSYGALARQLGNPHLAREVGAANARNPLSIVVPCHRVVGADGKLVGYAGGLDRKRFLLALETRCLMAPQASPRAVKSRPDGR
jgi:methylated-DNA-[protein]-cysteine S-methyltransferase